MAFGGATHRYLNGFFYKKLFLFKKQFMNHAKRAVGVSIITFIKAFIETAITVFIESLRRCYAPVIICCYLKIIHEPREAMRRRSFYKHCYKIFYNNHKV